MTARAGGSNAPLRRTDGQKNAKVRELVHRYMKEGLSRQEAEARALLEVKTDRQA